MTSGLVLSNYSLPAWQAVKTDFLCTLQLAFFQSWATFIEVRPKLDQQIRRPATKKACRLVRRDSRFYFSYAPINVMTARGGGGVGGRGGQGMGWGFDCLCWPWGSAFDLSSSPRGGIFESFFARHGDIWLPTRTKKTETKHTFHTSMLHACAVWSGKIWRSWRPTRTSESWVDFTVLSSNLICFSVFLINWTS